MFSIANIWDYGFSMSELHWFQVGSGRSTFMLRHYKVDLLTQCAIANIRTAFFALFFSLLPCNVCLVHTSALFSYFFSFSGLPSPPFFLFSLHNWDIPVLSLSLRSESVSHGTKHYRLRVEKHSYGRTISCFGQASEQTLIFNESIYSYHGNLHWSHLTLQPQNPSSKKQANKSVGCMNLPILDKNRGQKWLWSQSPEQPSSICSVISIRKNNALNCSSMFGIFLWGHMYGGKLEF